MPQRDDDFCTIEEAMAELRDGRMIILVDDENRENEGDLVIAAEKVTPEAINFMIRNACGLVCLAMSPAICIVVSISGDRINCIQPPTATEQKAMVLSPWAVSGFAMNVSQALSTAARVTGASEVR